MSISKSIAKTTALFIFVVILGSSVALAAQYNFTQIVDSSGAFTNLQAPVLNNLGNVAFIASKSGVPGVYSTSGGQFVTITDTSDFVLVKPEPESDPLPVHFTEFRGVSINNSGMVSLDATPSGAKIQLVVGNGGPITTKSLDNLDQLTARVTSINDSGVVAYVTLPFPHNTFTASKTDFNTTINLTQNNPAFIADELNISMNNGGVVAVTANGNVLTSDGTTTTTLISTGGLGGLTEIFQPVINDSGAVAFFAKPTGYAPGSNMDAFGTYLLENGVLTTVADVNSGYPIFDGTFTPSLNNHGEVAFRSFANGLAGIFTGPNPLADRVIRQGDSLGGRTIQQLSTSAEMLNDFGQIAFLASFTDGSSALYLATPVPEPTSITLFGLGALSLFFVAPATSRELRA